VRRWPNSPNASVLSIRFSAKWAVAFGVGRDPRRCRPPRPQILKLYHRHRQRQATSRPSKLRRRAVCQGLAAMLLCSQVRAQNFYRGLCGSKGSHGERRGDSRQAAATADERPARCIVASPPTPARIDLNGNSTDLDTHGVDCKTSKAAQTRHVLLRRSIAPPSPAAPTGRYGYGVCRRGESS
jgi:hypothetical protein